MRRQFRKKSFLVLIILSLFIFLYNEYFIYYQVLFICQWPNRQTENFLNLMLISDTHLLGSRNGHWFDKLRREWQQYRSFQTARFLLKPDYIVIMGDITDEGKWCSDAEWNYYEKRVKELFYTDERTKLLLIVGNHDIGFHYDINEHKIERFNKSFNTNFINFHQSTIKDLDINLVLINSISLENDGCKFCRRTQTEIKKLNKTLTCLRDNGVEKCGFKNIRGKYSRPIIFTHYPLYRDSDSICPYDIDSELAVTEKNPKFRPNYDCLSMESTHQMINFLQPRLVFNGHTHYSCYNEQHNVPEFTIPSFSWRNIKVPSMLLVQLNNDNHQHSKCFLPNENQVINLYIFLAILNFVYIFGILMLKFSKLIYYLKTKDRENKVFLGSVFIKQN